jgi:hypothetical protein
MKHLLLALLSTVAVGSSSLLAQGRIDLRPDDTIHSVLEAQGGKQVELRMKSGEKIAGKLEKVTGKLVHLSELKEAEFYDAVVDLDSVAAVVLRARSK